jgi:hypothetical protein
MKFISLAAMIMSVALAGIATAADPNGGPCKDASEYPQPGVFWMCGTANACLRLLADMYKCGTLANYNDGNPFLFYCSADSATNRVEVIKNCTCDDCCSVVDGGVGDGGHLMCT